MQKITKIVVVIFYGIKVFFTAFLFLGVIASMAGINIGDGHIYPWMTFAFSKCDLLLFVGASSISLESELAYAVILIAFLLLFLAGYLCYIFAKNIVIRILAYVYLIVKAVFDTLLSALFVAFLVTDTDFTSMMLIGELVFDLAITVVMILDIKATVSKDGTISTISKEEPEKI